MRNKLFLSLLILVLFFVAQSIRQVLAQQEQLTHPENISLSKTGSQNKISLDIKGMDIVDVLKILSTRANLNIVVGKNVTGKVTLFLKEVDLWDAFEIILLANDLSYEKKGDIINVMTQKDYELFHGERFQDNKQAKIVQLKYAKGVDLSRALNQIKTNIGKVIVDEGSNTLVLIDAPDKIMKMTEFIKGVDLPIETRVFGLNYAQADKLSPKLQDAITKGVGSIRLDERSNKIIITDYPEKLDEISKIISAFDEKTPQVLIDAQLIQVNPSDLFEMGVDWDYWIKKYFEARASLPVGTANRLFLGTVSSGTPTQVGQYKAVLDILRTIGDTKVLASPRVMALNNQEAKIHIGTKDAYITSTTSQAGTGTTVTSQEVNFVDTGIQLYVTPTINRDGFVTMKIKPEISDSTRTSIISDGQITQIPIVTTSEAETTVMVKDGVTIIIGGLRKDKRDKTVKKIPLFGDIPGIGFLFRSTSDNVTKTELVILLTPHIISGEKTYTDFSQIPPKEGAVAKMVGGNIVTEKITVSQKNEPLKQASAEYYKLVTDKVKMLASFDLPKGEKGEVELSFTLSRDGNIIDGPNIIETTNPVLNPFVLRTIKSASPFPHFPEVIKEDKQNFKISLSYG